jgi:folate-binding protein YgfZ
MQGYDELRSGAAWLDVSGRGKIRMAGEDRARLLHAMTTNHVQQLTPGTGCYAFFLTVQGRILADVNVLCRHDSFLLDTEPQTLEKLLEHLDKFIIADDVTLEDLTPALATIALEGPMSSDLLNSAGIPVPENHYGASAEWGLALVARLSVTGSPGFFVIMPVAEKDGFLRKIEAAGATPADGEAFRIVRLEHGKPRYGDDISERYLAQEANQMHAMHFHKGCYLGQEIVERLRSRGLISRVLTALEIEGQRPPESGTKLQAGGASVAEITSAAYSPALGKVVAMGYVRVDHAEPGTEMASGELRARVRNPR